MRVPAAPESVGRGAHWPTGIRFLSESDAVDDPDHKGFWTTLPLFNCWRHETYKDKNDDELQYHRGD